MYTYCKVDKQNFGNLMVKLPKKKEKKNPEELNFVVTGIIMSR